MTQMDSSLFYFLIGILFLGINQGILNSTFNNYLYDNFSIIASARGMIEFPRELPGFLLVFITGVLACWSARSWAVLVGLLSAIGIGGLGFLSPNMEVMLGWMFVWSLADHLFMSVESVMGLKFAKKNEEGRRLGQISGMRNLSAIVGTLLVYLLMGRMHWGYPALYSVAITTALIAGFYFSKMKKYHESVTPKKFVWRKEYSLYYIMNFLFGARKQIFLTFGPWVLVSIFKTRADTMAILFFIASIGGFIFRQYFGIMVDRLGERFTLALDAGILFLICLAFAYSKNIYCLYSFFIIDSLMFATRIARTTYLKKISLDPRDMAPTISLGITIDHAISMVIPFLGGLLWQVYGYKVLFLTASVLAFANLLVALAIKIPGQHSSSLSAISLEDKSSTEETPSQCC